MLKKFFLGLLCSGLILSFAETDIDETADKAQSEQSSQEEIEQLDEQELLKETKPLQISKPVSIASNGQDVRRVLYNLFRQVNKSFILEPKGYRQLYLNLSKVEFEEALLLICKACNYEYKQENGVYYIQSKIEKPKVLAKKSDTSSKKSNKEKIKKKKEESTKKRKELGKLSMSVYNRKVTTRMRRAKLTDVLHVIGKQARVKIELDKEVPDYRIDAILNKKSLRYALRQLAKKVNLMYYRTNYKSIRISRKS